MLCLSSQRFQHQRVIYGRKSSRKFVSHGYNQNMYITKNRPKDETVTISSCLITPWTDNKSWFSSTDVSGKPQHLLRHFKDTTSKLYGYWLIDLKLTTPEHLRLRIDIKKLKNKAITEIFVIVLLLWCVTWFLYRIKREIVHMFPHFVVAIES